MFCSDKQAKTGRLDCRDCQQIFTVSPRLRNLPSRSSPLRSSQCDTNHLTQPIDVYSEWIDACEIANQHMYAPQPGKKRRRNDDDDPDDDDENSDPREDSEEAAPRKKLVKGGKSLAQQEREMEEEGDELPDIADLSRTARRQVVEDDEDDE